MFAIIEIKNQQYCVSPGNVIKTDLFLGKKGDEIEFNKILFYQDKSNLIGQPYIQDLVAKCEIKSMGKDEMGVKGPKVLVFKKKRRKGYKKMQGHRQRYTEILIKSIEKRDR